MCRYQRQRYIARYPVTVAQFRAFVEATGFRIGDANALRDPDSRPVRWVSWHEALAYCDWVNKMLATSPRSRASQSAHLVREGRWRILLPSELEWEKGARVWACPTRSSPGVIRPTRIARTMRGSRIRDSWAVGCFPANGFGIHDMIGNVWEWTRSLWGRDWAKPDFAYPYEPDDPNREDLEARNDVLRVVRGGAWDGDRDDARCAYRGGTRPGGRYDGTGFRVVLRSAPVR